MVGLAIVWEKKRKKKTPSRFDDIISQSVSFICSFLSRNRINECKFFIFGGIFDRFPKLRVMFAHGGGSFPITLGRISHGYHCRPDLVNLNDVKDPRDYVGRFWVDGITHDSEALKYIINTFGIEKISYGTDYPFPLGDLEHGKFIENDASLSKFQKDKLMHENILDFLGVR